MVSRLNCSNLTLDFLDHLAQLTGAASVPEARRDVPARLRR
jgi:hypothetical protein